MVLFSKPCFPTRYRLSRSVKKCACQHNKNIITPVHQNLCTCVVRHPVVHNWEHWNNLALEWGTKNNNAHHSECMDLALGTTAVRDHPDSTQSLGDSKIATSTYNESLCYIPYDLHFVFQTGYTLYRWKWWTLAPFIDMLSCMQLKKKTNMMQVPEKKLTSFAYRFLLLSPV